MAWLVTQNDWTIYNRGISHPAFANIVFQQYSHENQDALIA